MSSLVPIGLGHTSVWTIGPKIKNYRPNVETARKYLDDVKYTPGDISNMMFRAHVPDYSPLNLTPKIPKISVKDNFQPVHVALPTAKPPSMTAHIMSKAIGLKTYSVA